MKGEDFRPKSLTFHPSRFTASLGQTTKFVKQFFKRMNHAVKSCLMRMSRQSTKVSINAFKSDGRCYRTFVGQLLHRDLELTIVYCPIGTKIINQGQVFIGDKNLKMHFWQNRNYNVMEFYDENNELEVLYANITSLPKIETDVIEYVDFELDILQRKGEEPKIVDEDEFREAAEKYNYSVQFQEACYKYCEQAIATIRQWQVGI